LTIFRVGAAFRIDAAAAPGGINVTANSSITPCIRCCVPAIAILAFAAGAAEAQITLNAGPIAAVSGLDYVYPVDDDADAAPESATIFPTSLFIQTANTGPFIITFSARCDMRGGSSPGGGIMLVHVTLDGEMVNGSWGEVEMFRAGPGEFRVNACAYTWIVPKVAAGRHVVNAGLRIFGGYGGGFARVVQSTLTVLHNK
jgi:hypothetical protein